MPARKSIDPLPPRQETPPEGYDEKVIVACKIPLPWVELHLDRQTTRTEEGQWGSKTIKIWERDPNAPIVRIRGTAYPAAQPPEGFPDRPEKLFGFAINRNVSKAFWDAFVEQKKDWPPLKNGHIFAFKKLDDVRARASELRNLVSGFEPINPKGDDRNPKPVMGALSPITVEEERGRKMPAAT